MRHDPTRRRFLKSAAAMSVASLGEWAALAPLGPAHADEAKVTPDLIRFGADIEPVVKLIEEMPQEKCVAVMVEQLKKGLPYRQFLAALYLAAIRAAKWHGSIHGYDHSAYLVHSAYQLSLDLPAGEQLLPAFYALIGFKGGRRRTRTSRAPPHSPGSSPPRRRPPRSFIRR
jgi:hypothetical protein